MTDIEPHSAVLDIRAAVESDLPAVAEIYWSAWHETHAPFMPADIVRFRDRQFFQKRADSFGPQVIVAHRDGKVMGFVVWGEGQLQQLWLRHDARGLGIGSALAEAAERRLAAAGARQAQLTCMAANEQARQFYERRGWSIVARFDKQLGHATGTLPVPCWRMVKDLVR